MVGIMANLPEIVKISTLDDQVMEVTGKVISECTTLMRALELPYDPITHEMFVPVRSAKLKNAVKLLEFFDLDRPFIPEVDRHFFLQGDHPGMTFLHGLSDEKKAEMKYVIEYLECDRLIDCLGVYILDTIKESCTYDDIPECLEICTTDNKIITVSKKVIKECKTLRKHYKKYGTDVKLVTFESRMYASILMVLGLCDLKTPHVAIAWPAENAQMTPAYSRNVLAFWKANQSVMNYFNSMTNSDLYEITVVMMALGITRICDLYRVYVEEKRTHLM
uniref:Cyclin N-terminal domain-containing protein n=1 Tax=Panagrellus redivivus TaxID=6233 RepID=A0A7E4URH2_PANRE